MKGKLIFDESQQVLNESLRSTAEEALSYNTLPEIVDVFVDGFEVVPNVPKERLLQTSGYVILFLMGSYQINRDQVTIKTSAMKVSTVERFVESLRGVS